MIFYSVAILYPASEDVVEFYGFYRNLNAMIKMLVERSAELGNEIPDIEDFAEELRINCRAEFGCFTVKSYMFEDEDS